MTRLKNTLPMRLFGAAFAVGVALSTVSCDRTPDGVIKPDEMAELMADIHVAESVADTERRQFQSDSMKQLLKQSVLARHGYDVAVFDSSLMYYGQHIDRYAKLYDDIVAILEKRIADAEEAAATDGNTAALASGEINISVDGDSVDVWGLPRTVTFSPVSPVASLPFGLNSDNYWERGDVYTLRGKLVGVNQGLVINLAVEYMNGTVDHITVRSLGNGWRSATLNLDTALVARYVYGTIEYTPNSDNADTYKAVLDSVSLVRTRFEEGQMRDPRTHRVGPRGV